MAGRDGTPFSSPATVPSGVRWLSVVRRLFACVYVCSQLPRSCSASFCCRVCAVREEFGSHVLVSEPDASLHSTIARDGFEVFDIRDSKSTSGPRHVIDLVVGCSGSTSLDPTSSAHLFADDVVFASASSGNHELGLPLLLQAVGNDSDADTGVVRCENPEVLSTPGRIHDTVTLSLRRGTSRDAVRLRYLNGGFPTTFMGQLHCVPGDDIAPTIGLMVAGAVQAASYVTSSTEAPRGLVPVDAAVDDWLIHARY